MMSNCSEPARLKYNTLLKSIENFNEQLPVSIRFCLYKMINELRQFIYASTKELANCINNKKINENCTDKQLKYDSDAMKIESLNIYTNEIVTHIIDAYQ